MRHTIVRNISEFKSNFLAFYRSVRRASIQGLSRVSVPIRRTIVFETPFEEKPAFTYALKMMDLNYAENRRASVNLEALDSTGFTMVLSAKDDTRMYGLGVTWMACP